MVVMADIPGLIEGASQGKGLGIQFLKHIQRTRLLVYVIDVNQPDIAATRSLLERELATFDASLAARPSVTTLTKIDTVTENDLNGILESLPADYIALSAVTGKGAGEFLQTLERVLDHERPETSSD